MLKTQKQELIETEMKERATSYQNDKLEFIKNPVIAEFLGFYRTPILQKAILKKKYTFQPAKFLFWNSEKDAFVARQQHIHTENKITI